MDLDIKCQDEFEDDKDYVHSNKFKSANSCTETQGNIN